MEKIIKIINMYKNIFSLLTFFLCINNITFSQDCSSIRQLFQKKDLAVLKLRDSLLEIISYDSTAVNQYEDCLTANLHLLDKDNVNVVTFFVNKLNNKLEEINFSRNQYNFKYNQKIIDALWSHVTDTNKYVRESVRTFYGSKAKYFEQLFANTNNREAVNKLNTVLSLYPDEFWYIWCVRDYKLYDLLPRIKKIFITNNKSSKQPDRNRKWQALITCYSLGNQDVFSLIEDFIDKEQDILHKYALYSYVLGTFHSVNEKKMLIKILKRKDIMTDLPDAERLDFPLNNCFTEFIAPHIKVLYEGYNVELICKKQNPYSDVQETEKYSRFHRKCLFNETIKWFKSNKLLK